jgi:hypothetical protein
VVIQLSIEIDITWTPVIGPAATYTIARNGVVLASGVTAQPYRDLTAQINTTYTYTVQAVNVNGAGLPSGASNSVSTPPAQVTGLTATPVSSSEIDLAWTATPGALTYNVRRGGTIVATPATNSDHDTGLTAATQYSYTVSAVGVGGEGAQSSAVLATTLSATGRIFVGAFGHEFDIGYTHGPGSDTTALITLINGLPSYIKGVLIRTYMFWYDDGASGPEYTGSNGGGGDPWVTTILNALQTAGKFGTWTFEDRTFGSPNSTLSNYATVYPPRYFTNGWVLATGAAAAGNLQSMCSLWVSACNTQWTNACVHFLQQHGTHPALSRLSPGGESSIDQSYCSTANYTNYLANQETMFQALSAVGTEIPTRWQGNNCNTLAQMLSQLAALNNIDGMVIAGPDPENPGPTTPPTAQIQSWQAGVGFSASNAAVGPNYTSVTTYGVQPPQNSMSFGAELQGFNGAGTTPTNLIKLAQAAVGANYFTWSLVSGVSGYTQANIQTAISGTSPNIKLTGPNDGNTWVVK